MKNTCRSVALLSVMVASAGMCATSGLNVIPTADVVERGVLAVEFDMTGDPTAAFKAADSSTLLQYGLAKNVEVGYDVAGDGDESSDVWNAKVRWPVKKGAVALGIQNAGSGQKSQPYVVGYVEIGSSRVHSGLIRFEGQTRVMLGYDRPLSERVALLADYTTGSENAASLGLGFTLSDQYALTTAFLRNNSGSDRYSYDVLLSWYPLQ